MPVNYSFHDPWILLLLVPLLGLGWHLWRSRDTWHPRVKLPALHRIYGFRAGRGALLTFLPLLRVMALTALIIALARPQLSHKEEKVEAEAVDIILTMDLSVSMLSKDFQPDRLEVSKAVAIDFVKKRPYDRFGVVGFSGEAMTVNPLTSDHEVVVKNLAGLRCGILEHGTAIGMGLATAVNRIKDSKAKSKVIILLSDGVNNSGYINPMTAAEMARSLGIKVYTIAVGTEGEALTPISQTSDGRFMFGLARVEIDEALLKSIAENTGGRFYRATNELALQRVYEDIDKLEKTKIEVTSYTRYSDEYPIFVGTGLLLLLLEALLAFLFLRAVP